MGKKVLTAYERALERGKLEGRLESRLDTALRMKEEGDTIDKM